MREEIYEESSSVKNHRAASAKYNTCSTAAFICYVLAAVWAFHIFMLYDFSKGELVLNILFAVFPLVFLIGAAILINILKNKFYADFDYAIVSGSIRFSKIIKNKKRKFIAIFDAKDIDHMGKIGSKTFMNYMKMSDVKKIVLTSNRVPNEGCDFYYIAVVVKGVRTLFVLECTKHLLYVILQYSRKGILDEDL